MGSEESGHCKEVVVVERFQPRVNVWIFCPLGRKKVAVSGASTVFSFAEHNQILEAYQ